MNFEGYVDDILRSDELGIYRLDGGKVGWFKDPDGNTFAIAEPCGTDTDW